jgi:hypothetical protein
VTVLASVECTQFGCHESARGRAWLNWSRNLRNSRRAIKVDINDSQVKTDPDQRDNRRDKIMCLTQACVSRAVQGSLLSPIFSHPGGRRQEIRLTSVQTRAVLPGSTRTESLTPWPMRSGKPSKGFVPILKRMFLQQFREDFMLTFWQSPHQRGLQRLCGDLPRGYIKSP